MGELVIFGKKYTVVNKSSDKDAVKLVKNKIIVTTYKKSANSLISEFLADLLHSQLLKIYRKLRKRGSIEIFGDLDFKVVEKIDRRKQRIAKLKGNQILVKTSAIVLPKPVLEYVIAHEIAHVFTKRHTKRFWRIVELMCPHFEKSQKLLTEYASLIAQSINIDY